MTARRFDTDTLLGQLLEGNGEAFQSFYERYRGRVYRFIVRQCGNGEQGQAAYISVWANLINARRKCDSKKSLKYAFLKSLQRPLLQPLIKAGKISQLTLMPRELEEEGGWSTLLVELVRRLPEGLRKRFLFRYEIGLSNNAIAQIFGESASITRGYITEAERELLEGLSQAGCTKKISLDALYRESRILKPPATWNELVIESYPGWLKNGVPETLLRVPGKVDPISKSTRSAASVKGFLKKTLGHLKSDITKEVSPDSHYSAT